MTVKELEEFRVICERGSLAKASKELFMSPQGLSRVLKNLENELDCTLVNRVVSGIELTESGECLKKYAETILKEYEELKKDIEKIKTIEEGNVDLLVACDIMQYLTPECILEFQKLYPNITFSYAEYPDRMVEKMLLDKEGNVALSIGPFTGECIDAKILTRRKLGLLVYEGHPLSKRGSVRIQDLREERLYLENRNFKMNEVVQSKCWNRGFEPKIAFETNGFDLCYKMCRMKKGLSITVDFIHEDMKSEGLCMIPFEESEEMFWEIGFLTLKENACEQSVETFRTHVEKYIV